MGGVMQAGWVPCRADTGPIRFGDDWPGVFIRGDEAQSIATLVEEACRCLPDGRLEKALRRDLGEFAKLLRSCWVCGDEAKAVAARQHEIKRQDQELFDRGVKPAPLPDALDWSKP